VTIEAAVDSASVRNAARSLDETVEVQLIAAPRAALAPSTRIAQLASE
jgi:hypothetical protein